jgi:hypothetical protein
MEKWERVRCFFFLLVGITVFFGLSSAGCTKESTQTGLPGSQSSIGGQGYPGISTGGSTSGGGGTSTGGQGYPGTSTGQQISQVSQGSTFAKAIGGSGEDIAYSIVQSSDGGYVVAGGTSSFGAGNVDIYVVKLDSAGNVQWTKTIGGSGDDEAISIIRSSDGGYIVAGGTESFGAGKADIFVVELDSSGNVVWAKTIGGSKGDRARSIIQSSDGGYVVVGGTESFGEGGIYVVKLDNSGNVQWTKTIGGGGASSIIQSSDGGYVVAGRTESFGAGKTDIYVVKLDSAGNVVWAKTIGGSDWDAAYSTIQSSDGGYVVAGLTWSFGAGYDDMYVVKMDSSGNVVWTKTIGGSYYDGADSVIQSSDGGYVVVGSTGSFGEGGIYVVKLVVYC